MNSHPKRAVLVGPCPERTGRAFCDRLRGIGFMRPTRPRWQLRARAPIRALCTELEESARWRMAPAQAWSAVAVGEPSPLYRFLRCEP
jgi:hypothetical protein